MPIYSSDIFTGGTANASDVTNGAATNAYDDALNTYWAPSGTVGWVQYDLGTTKTALKYGVYGNATFTYMPKDWTFKGSNDGTIFTTLDTQVGQTWLDGSWKYYNFNNSTAYRYYRFDVTANGGASFTATFELESYTQDDFDVSSTTSLTDSLSYSQVKGFGFSDSLLLTDFLSYVKVKSYSNASDVVLSDSLTYQLTQKEYISNINPVGLLRVRDVKPKMEGVEDFSKPVIFSIKDR